MYRIVSQWGQTALYGASKNGHLGVAEKLLAQPGIDINAGGATPLYIAAEQVRIVLHGHATMTSLLVRGGTRSRGRGMMKASENYLYLDANL